MQIVLASGNVGKIEETQWVLSDLPIEWIPQTTLHISSVPETGTTFLENALLKARHAAKISGLPALADDSGLSIDALSGAPGIYSARYAGEGASDSDRIQRVLLALRQVPDAERSAHFCSVTVLVQSFDDEAPLICEGVWPGRILHQPCGQGGFGYDPIFYVPTHGCSAAELDIATKNRISHRGQALHQMRSAIVRYLQSSG